MYVRRVGPSLLLTAALTLSLSSHRHLSSSIYVFSLALALSLHIFDSSVQMEVRSVLPRDTHIWILVTWLVTSCRFGKGDSMIQVVQSQWSLISLYVGKRRSRSEVGHESGHSVVLSKQQHDVDSVPTHHAGLFVLSGS